MLVWVVEASAWNGERDLPFENLPFGNGHEFQYAVFLTRNDAQAWRKRTGSDMWNWTRIRRYRLVPVRGKKG